MQATFIFFEGYDTTIGSIEYFISLELLAEILESLVPVTKLYFVIRIHQQLRMSWITH